MKPHAPLLGYNNNIPHKGRVFHVQTEDAGARRAYIVTHLFADGGRVVQTAKQSYDEYLERDDLADQVRALMRQQHKAMVVALRSGEFDSTIERDLSAAVAAAAEQPPPAQPGTPPRQPSPQQPAAPRPAQRPPAATPPPAHQRTGTPPANQRAVPRPAAPGRSLSSPPPADSIPTPPQGSPVPIDELERAAAEAERAFLSEIQALSAADSEPQPRPGAGDERSSPGSYRYVESGYRPRRSVPPPSGGKYSHTDRSRIPSAPPQTRGQPPHGQRPRAPSVPPSARGPRSAAQRPRAPSVPPSTRSGQPRGAGRPRALHGRRQEEQPEARQVRSFDAADQPRRMAPSDQRRRRPTSPLGRRVFSDSGAGAPAGAEAHAEPAATRPFGQGLVSDQPLDEVMARFLAKHLKP